MNNTFKTNLKNNDNKLLAFYEKKEDEKPARKIGKLMDRKNMDDFEYELSYNPKYTILEQFDSWYEAVLPPRERQNYKGFVARLKEKVHKEDYKTNADYRKALLRSANYKELSELEIDVFLWDITEGEKNFISADLFRDLHEAFKFEAMIRNYAKIYYKN